MLEGVHREPVAQEDLLLPELHRAPAEAELRVVQIIAPPEEGVGGTVSPTPMVVDPALDA